MFRDFRGPKKGHLLDISEALKREKMQYPDISDTLKRELCDICDTLKKERYTMADFSRKTKGGSIM